MWPMSSHQVLHEAENMATLTEVFKADGSPSKVIFFRQSRDVLTEDGEVIEGAEASCR